jgi:4-amino-4-deoxy-L-arabinose transferase-like glycosyltransferase
MKLIGALLCNRRPLLIFTFLASILIQSVFLSLLPNPQQRNQSSDYIRFYEPVAQNILSGKGIIGTGGNLATRYPPGYPIILSMVFGLADCTGTDRLGLIAIFNVLTTAISCFLVFLVGELIFSPRTGLISSLIWITYPFNLWLIKQPNSEVPFILLLYFGIWIFIFAIKKRYFALTFIAGVILALAALVRPASTLLGFLFALALLFYKEIPRMRRIFYAMLLLLGCLVTILPWEIHVLSSTGHLIPLSTGGPPSIRDGLTFAVKPGAGGDRAPVPRDVMALMERIAANKSNLNTTANIFDYLVQELTNKPAPILKLVALKLCRSWYGTDEMWYEKYILAIQVLYLIIGIIGIIFGIRICRDRLQYIIFLLAIVFYFWGMTVLVLSILRYMIPAMGFIIIFSAIPIDTIITRWNQSLGRTH